MLIPQFTYSSLSLCIYFLILCFLLSASFTTSLSQSVIRLLLVISNTTFFIMSFSVLLNLMTHSSFFMLSMYFSCYYHSFSVMTVLPPALELLKNREHILLNYNSILLRGFILFSIGGFIWRRMSYVPLRSNSLLKWFFLLFYF